MAEDLVFYENGIHMVVSISDEKDVRLVHLAGVAHDPATWHGREQQKWYRMVECQVTGQNQNDHHGEKNTGTAPASRLRYLTHRDTRTQYGRKLAFELADGLETTIVLHYQFFDGCRVLRAWTDITHHGSEPIGIEHVSSFCLNGLTKGSDAWDDCLRLHVPHNTWTAEVQWTSHTLRDLGFQCVTGAAMHRIHYGATGSWPCSNHLPMGALEHLVANEVIAWQIETIGSWHWEIGELGNSLYLNLSGPSEKDHLWWKSLAKGATFSSVPVAVCIGAQSVQDAWRELTTYRRIMRQPHRDLQSLPVIFNDYMNCLWGDPTTEKLLPLIQAAAAAGCEVFCIDAGWYDSGFWWDRVGEWQPSPERFPDGGIQRPLAAIRAAGMTPGLWLEIEVMGISCPLARHWPDACFFMRHGKRIIDHSRYQLDFRHPLVRQHADAVIDRIVGEWGVGYIKNDYNIQIGPGTDIQADSPGDGLEEHNRAFLAWLCAVQERYPDLMIEACASGGMRTSYAMLGVCSLQSTTDQTDYRKVPSITTNSLSAIAPEQAGIWSYPQGTDDAETIVFNAVNALPARIHQSGPLHTMPTQSLALVKEAIAYYKSIRADIPQALPVWPIGLNRMCDGWHALGLECSNHLHLAVWRTHSPDPEQTLPLPAYRGQTLRVQCGYPAHAEPCWRWEAATGLLTVRLDQPYRARMLRIDLPDMNQ